MAEHIKMSPVDRKDPKDDKDKDGLTPTLPKAAPTVQQECHLVDVTAMIRSLQRTEGLSDCFRRGQADCDQLDCVWRQYCLGSPAETHTDSDH